MANKDAKRGRVSAVPEDDQKRLAKQIIERGRELGSREKAWGEVIAEYRKHNKAAPKTFAAGQSWIEKFFPEEVQRRRRRGAPAAAARIAAARPVARPAGRPSLAESIDYRDVFARLQQKAKKNEALRQILRETLYESLGLDALVG